MEYHHDRFSKNASIRAQGRSVLAGHNLAIHATDGDINVQGSQLQAGNDALLDASRDIIMKSGENTSALTGKNESKGGTVGIGIGAGSGGWGIQISASVNKASGKETGNGLTPTESASQTVRAYWMAYLKIRKEKGPR